MFAMTPRKRRPWLLLAVVLGILVVTAYLVGFRPLIIWAEVACPSGYTEQPISIVSYVYRCVPPGGTAGADRQGLPVGSRQRFVGVYLTNLRARLFECDFVSGCCHWLARDVPSLP